MTPPISRCSAHTPIPIAGSMYFIFFFTSGIPWYGVGSPSRCRSSSLPGLPLPLISVPVGSAPTGASPASGKTSTGLISNGDVSVGCCCSSVIVKVRLHCPTVHSNCTSTSFTALEASRSQNCQYGPSHMWTDFSGPPYGY